MLIRRLFPLDGAARPYRFLSHLSRFRVARAGVAAVEFALILPIMVLIYLGLVEVTFGVNMDRKRTILSRTIGDLTGRVQNVSDAELNTIFGAGLSVMAPFASGDVRMRLTSVNIREVNGEPQARVCWSEGRNMPPRPANEVIPLPDGFNTPGSSFILAEVEKLYTPMFGHAITGPINLKESTPWPVRNVAQVARAGVQCA